MATQSYQQRSDSSSSTSVALNGRPFVVPAVQAQEEATEQVQASPEQAASQAASLLTNRYQVSAAPSYQPNWIARSQVAPETAEQEEAEEQFEETVQRSIDGAPPEAPSDPEDEPEDHSVQTKLTVGQPNDRYEQEADRVAEQVMSMPDTAVQRQVNDFEAGDIASETTQAKPLTDRITPMVQRQPAQLEQPKKDAFDLEGRLSKTKGQGNPLSQEVRSFMEPRFGEDFSHVRVHTGDEALEMTKELGAKAFAHGQDLYFGGGYQPGNNDLTAHELTHVVQQTGSRKRKSPTVAKTAQSNKKPAAAEMPEKANSASKKDKALSPSTATKKPASKKTNPPKRASSKTAQKAPNPSTASKSTASKKTPKNPKSNVTTPSTNVPQTDLPIATPQLDQVPQLEAQQPQAMFVTDEANVNAIDPSQVVGNTAEGAVIFQADNPEQVEAEAASGKFQAAQKSQTPPIQRIPEAESTQVQATQKQQAQVALQQLQTDGQQQLSQINQTEQTIAPRVNAAIAQAQSSIDAAAQRNKQLVQSSIQQTKAQFQQKAASSRQQVQSAFAKTQASIRQTTQQSKTKLQTDYQASLATLSKSPTALLASTDQIVQKAQQDLLKGAAERGAKAIAQGQKRQAQYMAEPLPKTSAVGDFFNGGDYHKNRRQAKAEAAIGVAQKHQEEITKKANEVASQLPARRGDIATGAQQLVDKYKAQLEQQRTSAIAKIDQAQQQNLAKAQQQKQTQLDAITKQLNEKLAALTPIAAQQSTQIDQAKQQQQQSLQKSSQTAITKLQKSAQSAKTSGQKLLQRLSSEAGKHKNPSPAAIQAIAKQTKTQLAQLTTGTKTQLDLGLTQVCSGFTQQQQQASSAIDQIGQATTALAAQQLAEFNQAMATVDAAATQAFTSLENQHKQAIDAAAHSATQGFKTAVDGIQNDFKTIEDRLRTVLADSTKGLLGDFDKSLGDLDGNITREAEKAADKVQPRWKSVVKFIIEIAIAIIVSVAIAAVLASGVGLLAAIGIAALIGAAGGLLKQAATDLLEGNEFQLKNYGMAMLEGSIGGIFSLAGAGAGNFVGGKVGGWIAGKTASKFAQIAVTKGAEVVVGTVIDTVGSCVTDVIKRSINGEEISLATVWNTIKTEGVKNLLSNTAATTIGTVFQKPIGRWTTGLFDKMGIPMPRAPHVSADVPSKPSSIIDPNTNRPFGAAPEKVELIDPNTNRPVGAPPEKVDLIDPNTNRPVGAPPEKVDLIDPNTNRPVGAPPEKVDLIDPNTNRPVGAPPEKVNIIDPSAPKSMTSGASLETSSQKMATGAQTGKPATPATIADGTVKMQDHPQYSDVIQKAKAEGYEVKITKNGTAHVEVREIVDPSGKVIRVEKILHLQEDMRFLDLEHELGHIQQQTRFNDGSLPTERLIEQPDGSLKKAPDQQGVLTTGQNAITEYHNRLDEFIRLYERGAGPDLLKEHQEGVNAWFREYWKKGIKGGRSPSQKAWVETYFPDMKSLESRYNEITKQLTPGSNPNLETPN